jgi:predicted nucleotidyltransferase
MLDLERIDLAGLREALNDHSDRYDTFWAFDTRTGATQFFNRDAGDFEDVDDLDEALLPIEPLPSSDGYADMADFVELVTERRPAELLARAIEGRGAFRRFRDTLFEFPELSQQWSAFSQARMTRRALRWLADNGVIDREIAEQAQKRYPDPPLAGTSLALARAVAEDLRALYGDRLVQVVMYGSRARGDNREDSDLDLLVVLDRVDSWWKERDFMGDVIWDHTVDSGILVSALPMPADEFAEGKTAFLRNVTADGVAA